MAVAEVTLRDKRELGKRYGLVVHRWSRDVVSREHQKDSGTKTGDDENRKVRK
jgi:hypothetical protein